VGTNASDRTSYWKEVAGTSYTASTTTTLDLTKTNADPNVVSFTLDNVPDKFTFTNTGEQQCVIVYIEYHFGGTGISTVQTTPIRAEYFTVSGKRVTSPTKGMYILRSTMPDGRTVSKKVIF